MLKAMDEIKEFRTNHIMVADKKERLYCRLVNQVIKWSDEFYHDHCIDCPYLNGLGQNIGVIECKFNDDTENITEIVEDPFEFVQSGFKLGFKKSE